MTPGRCAERSRTCGEHGGSTPTCVWNSALLPDEQVPDEQVPDEQGALERYAVR